MTDAYRQYLQLVNELRDMRRSGTGERELRPILEALEDLFHELGEDEQETANAEGWRGWPDEYDARMEQLVEIDPEDPKHQRGPARMVEAA